MGGSPRLPRCSVRPVAMRAKPGCSRPSGDGGRPTWEPALNHNPLDFVEGNLVAGAVIELGGLGRLVGGNLLGLLDGAAGFEVGGDAGGPERVAANPRREPGGGGPPLNHVQG